ncbi:helix-turn-helix transcriptional regulator [Mycolicibacterium neoaurum]|uniref:Transcriptional activator NphR n=1 Tax=Mycolicibacterium neoaurum TaxID=1795 RepID=A0AAV2WHM5_MYCNE|nr:helix-turn-helix domain-containing protein [Mycolicibacterium neoaurum]TLH50370.1 AraC family transcriptional regulator [Mycolicibacterium neoaurum]CDQ43208.1 Transcriptional activator NphR [Mycolicibacterium neoaurum]
MLDVVTTFAPGTRACTSVRAVRRTAMHAHPDALEIVYVLAGDLHLRVSSEDFDLTAGDYAVVNRLDPHLLDGSADNVTAIIHLDLCAFTDIDPFIEDILFACESFDLPRFRKQEALLRGLLLDIIDLADGSDSHRLDARSSELVHLLCTGYTIADYYQRDRPMTDEQRSKLRSIQSVARHHLDSRDVLQDVAAAHHYSKSYVSHFVKNHSAISFSSMVTALRVMHAERFLLTTDHTMRDISAQCGFSDVKYFTRCYADWFKQTPAEYRARYRPLVQRDDIVEQVTADTTAGLIAEHRSRVANPTDPPRLSITPILLKNVGSRADLFERIKGPETDEPAPPAPSAHARRHLLPLRVGSAEMCDDHLIQGLKSFVENGSTPCLMVDYAGRQTTLDTLSALAGILRDTRTRDVNVWLVYPRPHLRDDVDALIDTIDATHGLNVQAVMIG